MLARLNRDTLKELATLRIEEANTLLDAGRWDGAYYLAGYAVECALKACIAKNTRQYDFPDKDLAVGSHTHNIAQLVRIAGLEKDLEKQNKDKSFGRNWLFVKDWSEATRYQRKTEQEARDLYAAIADSGKGVLRWIEQYW